MKVDLIVRYLSAYKLRIKDIYDWSVSPKALKSLEELGFIERKDFDSVVFSESSLEQSLILCKILSPILNQNQFEKAAVNWILKDWGGINKDLDTRETLLSNLPNLPFDRVASASKVATFKDPKNYIIYDSRVASMLNWIVFSGGEQTFFRMPPGQSTILDSYCLDKMIAKELGKVVYFSKEETYYQANKLIADVGKVLWNEHEHASFYTQQLLFALAVHQETRQRIMKKQHELFGRFIGLKNGETMPSAPR